MIFSDHREERSGIPQKIEEENVPITRKVVLKEGDYVVQGKYYIPIEVKEAVDFITSIIDGRYNNQLYKLSTAYKESRYFIYGSINEACYQKNFDVKAAIHAYNRIPSKVSPEGKSGIVIPQNFETEKDLVDGIIDMHTMVQNDEYRIRSWKIDKNVIKKGERFIPINIVGSIPGIGEKRAISMLKTFKTARGVFNSSYKERLAVDGIGKGFATKLDLYLDMEYVDE